MDGPGFGPVGISRLEEKEEAATQKAAFAGEKNKKEEEEKGASSRMSNVEGCLVHSLDTGCL